MEYILFYTTVKEDVKGAVPKKSNYSGAAGGRTFPSPAGWHVVDFFYTDDSGVYFFPTRDAPSLVERDAKGQMDLNA